MGRSHQQLNPAAAQTLRWRRLEDELRVARAFSGGRMPRCWKMKADFLKVYLLQTAQEETIQAFLPLNCKPPAVCQMTFKTARCIKMLVRQLWVWESSLSEQEGVSKELKGT